MLATSFSNMAEKLHGHIRSMTLQTSLSLCVHATAGRECPRRCWLCDHVTAFHRFWWTGFLVQTEFGPNPAHHFWIAGIVKSLFVRSMDPHSPDLLQESPRNHCVSSDYTLDWSSHKGRKLLLMGECFGLMIDCSIIPKSKTGDFFWRTNGQIVMQGSVRKESTRSLEALSSKTVTLF